MKKASSVLHTLALTAGIVLGLCAASADASQGGSAAADTQHRIEFFPPGQARTGPPVVLTFTGRVYPPAATTPTTADEKFVLTALEVNRTGTLDDVLQLWDVSDREEIRRAASNPEAWRVNRTFFENIRSTTFVGRINYGPYFIFIVNHGLSGGSSHLKTYPVLPNAKSAHGFVLTNDLSSDPVYTYIASKYANELNLRAQAK